MARLRSAAPSLKTQRARLTFVCARTDGNTCYYGQTASDPVQCSGTTNTDRRRICPCGTTAGQPKCPAYASMIVSQNYTVDFTGGYDNNMNCKWGLKCQQESDTMRLHFSRFDMESNFDYLTVYDCYAAGDAGSSTQVKRLTGTSIPQDVNVSDGQMLLKFTSDGSNVRDGFLATASCVGSGCVDQLQAACGDTAGTDCVMCAGTHQSAMRAAGCANSNIQAFCDTNVPRYVLQRQVALSTAVTAPGSVPGITIDTAEDICSDAISGVNCWGFTYATGNNTAYFKTVATANDTQAYISNRTHSESSGDYFVQRGSQFDTSVLQTLPSKTPQQCAEACDSLSGNISWVLGGQSQSCDDACETHGGCSTGVAAPTTASAVTSIASTAHAPCSSTDSANQHEITPYESKHTHFADSASAFPNTYIK